MTLAELQADDRETILISDIKDIIGAAPQSIRIQAHTDPQKLGFPVVIVGTRVRIPRIPFLKLMGVS